MRIYPHPDIPLIHHDAFTLLVAVLLSAQCTDARVNLVTPELFLLAPTPELMWKLGKQKIQTIIRSCGLSERKAQALEESARILTEQHHGQVPCSFNELEALPGVGHKTASVVMAQAFNIPAFPVDTHIFRLARRWQLSTATSVEGVEKDLKRLFPEDTWIDLHLRLVLYGREFCPARVCTPKCTICTAINNIRRKN